MQARKAVALGQQLQDPAAVAHEVATRGGLRIFRHGLFVAEDQHGQALMLVVECIDDRLPWPGKAAA